MLIGKPESPLVPLTNPDYVVKNLQEAAAIISSRRD